jgi:hypothetical protein
MPRSEQVWPRAGVATIAAEATNVVERKNFVRIVVNPLSRGTPGSGT